MASSSGVQTYGAVPLNSRVALPDFSKISLLVKKTDWVFGLCISLIADLCVYNLWKGYQHLRHNSFQLDQNLKDVQIHALLNEVRSLLKDNPLAEIKPLLQKCETLQAPDPDKVSLELIKYYAKVDVGHAYQLAVRLSSPSNLFQAAKSIQNEKPDFDSLKLLCLYEKSLQSLNADAERSGKDIGLLCDETTALRLAKAFHGLRNNLSNLNKSLDLASIFIKNNLSNLNKSLGAALLALSSNEKYTCLLSRVRAFCEFAEVCHEVDRPGIYYEEAMREVKAALSEPTLESMSKLDQVRAHVAVARLFLSTGNYGEMDEELKKIQMLFPALDSYARTKACVELADIFKKIQSTEGVDSKFKANPAAPIVKAVFDSLSIALQATTAKRRAKAYLNIANAYDNLDTSDGVKKQAICLAIEQIKTLPEGSYEEIKPKADLLLKVTDFYKDFPDQAREVLQLLETLYDKISSPDPAGNKTEIAITIIYISNKMKLDCKTFFNKYLSDLKNQKKDICSKIDDLIPPIRFLPEQRKAMLEIAEVLMSQVPSHSYAQMTSLIANGYLKIDRQKSLDLIKNYETSSATHHFVLAAFGGIVAGISYVYPQTRLFFPLGVVITIVL
jgi:hypothetical protein